MAVRRCALVLLVGAASCGPPSPGPVVQSVLKSYAPDLRIGDRIFGAARQRYDLQVAPYTGYQDTAFVTRDGLSGLTIQVNEYPGDVDLYVSRRARIVSVGLGVTESTDVARIIARLDSALGEPETFCYHVDPGGHLISRYWAGRAGRGVRLILTRVSAPGRDSTPGMGAESSFPGGLWFGAEAPKALAGIRPESCA